MIRNWLDAVYNGHDRISTCCGSPIKDEMMLIDHDGVPELEKVGETNLYAEIQTHKDSCDINSILDRYANGDVTALDKRKAEYIDILNAPKSLAEMYSFIQNCSEFFDHLPLEIRKEYDHNPYLFVKDIGSKKFMEMFGYDKKETEEKIEEVSENA